MAEYRHSRNRYILLLTWLLSASYLSQVHGTADSESCENEGCDPISQYPCCSDNDTCVSHEECHSNCVDYRVPCLLSDLDDYESAKVPQNSKWNITCDDGWEAPDGGPLVVECENGTFVGNSTCVDINECERKTHSCDFENKHEICMNEPEGNFTCVCRPGYIRSDNSIPCRPDIKEEPVDARCMIVNDREKTCVAETVDGISWPKTNTGCKTEWLKCPPGRTGSARRTCASTGIWESPDTTFCTNELAENITRKLEEMESADEASRIVDDTSGLLNDDIVLGGDLLKAVEIINQVLDKEPFKFNSTDDVKVKTEFSTKFLEVVNRLLNVSNEDHWKLIHANKGVPNGAASVFQFLKRFDSDVSKFVRENYAWVYSSLSNIEYQACVLTNCSKEMESVVVRHKERTRVTRSVPDGSLSEALLPPSAVTGLTNTTVAIVFVYRNFDDILPIGDGQLITERQWVSSITAVKRIKKVNSAVVSVMIYSDTGDTDEFGSLALKFKHKEEGYDPACGQMRFDNYGSIWSTDKCKLIQSGGTDGNTTCECYEPGDYALIMTLGKPQTPFLEEYKEGIALIANAVAILLLFVSFTFVVLSRITTDRNIILGISILSFLPMLVMNMISLSTNSNSAICRQISIGLQVAHLVVLTWITNLSVEVCLRLAFYKYTSTLAKFAYLVTGFGIPAIVFCLLDSPWGNTTGLTSCWSHIDVSDVKTICAAFTLTISVSLVCLSYTHFIFVNEKKKYEPEEWQQYWEELRAVMQFLFFGMTCSASALYTAYNDEPLAGYYVTAIASFVFASNVFLAGCATNVEMLTAIRVHYEGDEDYLAAMTEVRMTKNARFDARRQNKERAKKLEEQRKVEKKRVQEKSKAIKNMFVVATKPKPKVMPMSFDEDFSI
ncbi:cadherin EGF LAG seven-pass G-type receptor 2-like isoform X2 [Ptychodera flava]|uniref:cadherin EGF LAG seven-pass G-type receptor 2-like isoform X2 n=1 Tax=Ptychodera flava TaxID=63121 RepID=UPI00396A4710